MTELIRCPWVPLHKDFYVAYHDLEWGVPVHDDRKHFEFLVLEGAQAGLSWETILKRRAGYRQAFAGFDPQKVAEYDADKLEALLQDPGIIRNRQKVGAAITNARVFLKIQAEFGSFDNYIWRFVGGEPVVHQLKTLADYPVTSKEAEGLSADLRQRGMRFVGPTIVYAHLQACGLVNDHTVDCFRYRELVNIE